MNVLGDYLARPFGLIFPYQLRDQKLVYDRSGNLLAPADIFRVSLLVNHARRYPDVHSLCARYLSAVHRLIPGLSRNFSTA